MEPISCTHDKFDFTRTKKPLKRIVRLKQKPKRKATAPETQAESLSTQDIDVSNLPPAALCRYTVYIHHSTNRPSLRAIAEGLGAAVVTEMTSATTHLVIEPKGDPKAMKVVKQALANGIICSSPQWLIECYEKKMYLSAVHFPYAMEKETHVLGSHPSETAFVSDPFNNDYIDFDAEESRRANGGQTNLDGFITRGGQGSNTLVQENAGGGEGELSTPLHSYQPFDDGGAGGGGDDDYDPMPSTSQAYDTQDSTLEEEEEEMKREFYYNSNDSSAVANSAPIETTEQETEEERRLAVEKGLQAREAIKQRLARIEKEPERQRKTLPAGFGQPLKIWYGEHAVRSEEARKRKAVQSVLGDYTAPADQQQQQQRVRSSSVATTASSSSTSATRRQPTASTTHRQPVQYYQLKKPKV